eukprot:TRINITY_DN3767_c0_g1_i1.p1 TRINITY_DN3767_c0_g1~~TRINITY_DN3767_c0_g1_i1.p1  ORF type:complete len:536 (-),score=94.85 TRINITY_DN3767_c0_g1_i1:309-1814(-)
MKLDELFLEWLTLADTQGKLNSLLAMAAATPTKRKAEGSPAGAALMSANSKMKLDELFLEWLTLADTQGKLNSLLAGIRETKPLGTDSQQFAAAVQAGVTPLSPLAHIFKTPMIPSLAHTATQSPPRSPRSPRIQHRRPSRSGTGNPLAHAEPKSVLPPPKQHIPQFYFPMGKPPLPDQIQAELQRIQACFSHHGDAISKREDFLELCDVVCGMPMFMAGHLLTRLKSTEPTLSREKFLAWWSDNIRDCDAQARFFNCVRQKQNKFLCPEDFKGIMLELLETHSALEFLKATPEFQERYVETVILRIFYTVNRADNGRITLTELRRSNLVKVFKMVDEESDMNKITEFFSYEHFYVLYCKFWELDTDHDYELDKEAHTYNYIFTHNTHKHTHTHVRTCKNMGITVSQRESLIAYSLKRRESSPVKPPTRWLMRIFAGSFCVKKTKQVKHRWSIGFAVWIWTEMGGYQRLSWIISTKSKSTAWNVSVSILWLLMMSSARSWI